MHRNDKVAERMFYPRLFNYTLPRTRDEKVAHKARQSVYPELGISKVTIIKARHKGEYGNGSLLICPPVI